MTHRIVTWNVNGLRSVAKKGFLETVKKINPSVLCLQEVKANSSDITPDILDLPGYEWHWNSAERKGYSGTLMLSKMPCQKHVRGLGVPEYDQEGRIHRLEFDDFQLVNIYTPNAQRGLTRLPYRLQWDELFRTHLKELDAKKPVLFCGDLNVAHEEIDIANPKSNRKNSGFTDEERNSFSRTLALGFVDTFRNTCKEPNHYTWWSCRPGVRERNIGWRIDYFCASERLLPRVRSVKILQDIYGSDHCPVLLEISYNSP